MGEVLMHGLRLISYHSKLFHGGVLSYPIYDKEIYDLVQDVKKWKQHIMGKEMEIHTNHQTLQYL